jgi:hypothetical protein
MRRLSVLAAPVIFFVLMLALYPFRSRYQFDPDEGYNLAKALLVRDGYRLFAQIYSDQPPLLTYLLAPIVGAGRVVPARMLVLLFSTGTVFFVTDTLRSLGHRRAAVAAVLLLVTARNYLVLSVSVMVGLPAIAMACGSAWGLARWSRNRKSVWLVASALFLALSMATKLFTAFLVPVFGAWVLAQALWHRDRRADRSHWRSAWIAPSIWFAAAAAATALVLGALVPRGCWHELYETHVGGRDHPFVVSMPIGTLLRMDAGVYVLAALGTVHAIRLRAWPAVLFSAWSCAAAVAISTHSPVWFHHSLLVVVPACIPAGLAVEQMTTRASWSGLRGRWLQMVAVSTVLTGALLRWHDPDVERLGPDPDEPGRTRMEFIVALMESVQPTTFVVTNEQMAAYRAGVEVPPSLAVTSNKRIWSGSLHASDVVREILEGKPEAVVFVEQHWSPTFTRQVERNLAGYVLVYTEPGREGARAYLRADRACDPTVPLRRALATVADEPSGHDALGIALAAQGRDGEAVDEFRTALAFGGTDEVRIHLADALIASGSPDEGFALLTRWLGEAQRAAVDVPSTVALGRSARAFAWHVVTADPARRDARVAEQAIADLDRRTAALAITVGPHLGGPVDLEIRAAVRAATGDFDQAADMVRRANDAAGTTVPQRKAKFDDEIRCYRRREPWTEPPTFPRTLDAPFML